MRFTGMTGKNPMKDNKQRRKKTAVRLTVRILLILLISVLIGTGIYSINAKRVFNNALPMPLGFGVTVVLSGSMEPTLSVNDLILVTAGDSYEPGDIVIFQSGNSLTVHRVTEVGDGYVVTKGDANNTEDSPVSFEAVKGKMAFSIPYLGIVVQLLQSTPGTILMIALAGFLLHRSWKNERSEDDRELDDIKNEIRRLKKLEEEKDEKENSTAPEDPQQQ